VWLTLVHDSRLHIIVLSYARGKTGNTAINITVKSLLPECDVSIHIHINSSWDWDIKYWRSYNEHQRTKKYKESSWMSLNYWKVPYIHHTDQIITNTSIYGKDSAPRTWHSRPLIRMLPLYAHIWSFSMIYNICATFGHDVWPGHHSRMCFNPLEIYTMSFWSSDLVWSILTFFNVFMLFSMFACLYLTDRTIHKYFCMWSDIVRGYPYHRILALVHIYC
jgi:hypothetical protein